MEMVFCRENKKAAPISAALVIEATGAAASGDRDDRQLVHHLLDGTVQRGACILFTAAAAIGAARAGLQLGETLHAIGRGAADVMVGDGIA